MRLHLLLVKVLEENHIPPGLLCQTLNNYLELLREQLLAADSSKPEIDYLVGKDVENTVRAFVNLIDYASIIKRS